MAKNKKGGLGRGIEALFAENEVTELADETVQRYQVIVNSS